jgi:hypothetical protein
MGEEMGEEGMGRRVWEGQWMERRHGWREGMGEEGMELTFFDHAQVVGLALDDGLQSLDVGG